MSKNMRFGTRCVHAGESADPVHGAHTTPIYQTSTFVFDNAEQGALRFSGNEQGYTYGRLVPNTPTHAALAEKMASLEDAEAGQTFSSGMAAITAVVLSRLEQGDHMLSTDVVYGCTYSLFSNLLPKFGIDVTFVDSSDTAAVKKRLRKNTKLIFLETPANPTMTVCDIKAIARLAKEVGALTVVDNTFATPCFQKPVTLGADVVVHSATKYIGGHADLIGGVVLATRRFIDDMTPVVNDTGGTLGVHEAWLGVRGLKTLHLRMHRHAENALSVARYLENHPKVAWVRYPGLESHPQHAVAARQMSGFGGMLCFGIKGGRDAGGRLMNSVRLCSLAVSLGAVDTLISHPATMTHAHVPKDVRLQTGITDDLVRLSVGIEDAEDIVDDLDQALARV